MPRTIKNTIGFLKTQKNHLLRINPLGNFSGHDSPCQLMYVKIKLEKNYVV